MDLGAGLEAHAAAPPAAFAPHAAGGGLGKVIIRVGTGREEP